MYRHAIVRMPCEDCRVDLAPRTSLFSAGGGYLCWRCQMRREISDHSQSVIERARGASPWLFLMRLVLVCAATGLLTLAIVRQLVAHA
jgi:hypothetical protein